MKYLATALALAALAATPAFAAQKHVNRGAAAAAYAAYPTAYSSSVVIANDGQYLGQDPDAAVRFDLRREGDTGLYTGQ
ncbi:MAG: hypothetical protein JO237_02495 [Pseudolabrys sp.]|nr:hypothetical protein [Pseudolabrys sp.]